MSLQKKAEISILLLWDTWDLETIPCRSIDGLSSGFENQTFTKHPLASGRLSVSFGQSHFFICKISCVSWTTINGGKNGLAHPSKYQFFANYISFTSTLTSTHIDYDTLLFFFLSFGLLLFYRYYYSLNLLCAHSACQFSMLNIRKTR